MVVLNYLLDDLQAAQRVIFLLFPTKTIEDLHEVIVVLLQVKNAEVALGNLLQNSIGFFFDDLVFLLFEAVAGDIEDQLPSALEMQGMVANEVAETANHEFLYCEDLCLGKDVLEGFKVLLL